MAGRAKPWEEGILSAGAMAMIPRKTLLVVVGACWLTLASGVAQADQQKADSEYLRVARDGQGRPLALETAVVHFAPADIARPGLTVDLVAAVHIAEPEYYDLLNERFARYDVVLYELVAPEDTKPTNTDAGSGNPVSAVQKGMTELLELEFQLEGIDYNRDNFVHADMSPEEFRRSMRDRDESHLAIFLRMMGYAMAQQSKASGGPGDADLLLALLAKNRAMALKRLLAEQFEQLGGMARMLDGPNGSTLISRRNQVVMEVLGQEIGAGKKIAIFYGAGHMDDIERRLEEEFGLVRADREWLTAWRLDETSTGDASPNAPGKPSPRDP